MVHPNDIAYKIQNIFVQVINDDIKIHNKNGVKTFIAKLSFSKKTIKNE